MPPSSSSATSPTPSVTAAVNSVPGQTYVNQLAINSAQKGYQPDVTGVSGLPAAGTGTTPAQLAANGAASDPNGTINDITPATTPESEYTDAMNTYLTSLKNSNSLTLADSQARNSALNAPGETTSFAGTDANRIATTDAFGIDAANNTTAADLAAANAYKATLPATPAPFTLSPGDTRYNADGTVDASLPATPAKLDTSVVNTNGKQELVNTQTGQVIQDLGASTPTAAETNTADANSAEGQLTAAEGSDGYTDPNLYAKLRASSGLSASDFDNRFGYLVNPLSTKRLGIASSASNQGPSYTQAQQTSLIGAGIPSTELGSIQDFVNQYGVQAFFTNNPTLTSAQKTALNTLYGTDF